MGCGELCGKGQEKWRYRFLLDKYISLRGLIFCHVSSIEIILSLLHYNYGIVLIVNVIVKSVKVLNVLKAVFFPSLILPHVPCGQSNCMAADGPMSATIYYTIAAHASGFWTIYYNCMPTTLCFSCMGLLTFY